MGLTLNPKVYRLIENELRTGGYSSADELVKAALAALKQQRDSGDFRPGEMEELIQAGERSIKREGTIPASEVFADLRRRGQRHRRNRKAG